MERCGAAAIITNELGEVLLVHHTYGVQNWEIPGGAGEPGESPIETAIREVREETGLKVRAVATTGWYYDPGVDKLGAVFRCEILEGELNLPSPDGAEISECRFFPRHALPRPLSDWTFLRIRDALDKPSTPLPTEIAPRVWLGEQYCIEM